MVSVFVLAGAGAAWAFAPLPPGAQVNDDPGAGINPALNVSGEAPNADVVGGALTAGKVAVPWAIFRQNTSGADQVFVRSFAGGAWLTRGNGTIGGKSSASPTTVPGSLNFDQGVDGEAPAIDFAGAGRTVPWATWYEATTAFSGTDNIFASRFDNTGGKWIFGGQSRGTGTGTAPIPSLNIHTDQNAENPSVAGGSAVDPTKPGPWIAWQETDNSTATPPHQIFVVRPVGPGSTDCTGVTPTGGLPLGGFCWQQTGIERAGTGAKDPSLNVDPTRDGIEPDIAFTGANDAVPWVVWYETGSTGLPGLNGTTGMVFAAKGIGGDPTADGGFHWTDVGNKPPQQELDTTGTNKFGGCAENLPAEQACSLNSDPTADAEDPRVAAGTMNPANPTVPWVAWDEIVGGVHQVFVSRLVGGPTGNFVIANGAQPISTGQGDATRPDITFDGNTPYVSWRQNVGGVELGFSGHFVNPANPTFVLDESDVPLTSTADVREPISSGCIATPFNSDGAACQGGAVGTPFFLFTNSGLATRSLFSDAYAPDTPATAPPSGVSTSGGTLNGTVNPNGASVRVSFDFGPTAAYGQTLAAGATGPADAATLFSAPIGGLAPGTTIHYRAVATSDFGTFQGADQTLTTATVPPPPKPPPPPPPPPPPGPTSTIGKASISKVSVSGTHVSLKAVCKGTPAQKCKLSFKLTITETLLGKKVIAISAKAKKPKKTHRTVGLGSTNRTLAGGKSKTVKVFLNGKGKGLLAKRHTLRVRLKGTQSLAKKKTKTVVNRKVTFKAPKHKKKKK
ncbi:MAG TPA: hypothetical protein VGL51_20590 [Solirubrobacteraceae bacterium]